MYREDYINSINRVLASGHNVYGERTGVGTRMVFDQSLRHQLLPSNATMEDKHYSLPEINIRMVSPRIAFEELMWMLRGSTDVTELQEKDIHIWDGNSTREYLDSIGLNKTPENSIGKAYGYQMRNFGGVDQLKSVYESLMNNPNGRRHLISFWNVPDFPEMALHPCHYSYNFVVIPTEKGNVLNLKQNIRSNDLILGQPTNMMWANFFLGIMAKATGMIAGDVVCSADNYHIYLNHIDIAESKLLTKDTLAEVKTMMPRMWSIDKSIESFDDMLSLEYSDISLYGDAQYVHKLGRKDLPMAV